MDLIQKIINFILSLFGNKKQPVTENKSKKLCENDFIEAANLLGCEVAAIKAVIEVETGNRGGFLLNKDVNPLLKNPDEYSKYPVILFEGHIFYRQLKNKGIEPEKFMNTDTADILYKSWTKNYYGSKWEEYDRLDRACQIDNEAALLSCSYGLGQIMGFNYKACGYKSVFDFTEDMSESEGKQLLAFCNFIKSNKKLLDSLRAKDWKIFAYNYNGPEYSKNSYDKKLNQAYIKNQ